jgi:hypothetical protein
MWVQAIVVIAVFSFLYKDNPVFAAAQNFYVGCAAGHGLILAIANFKAKAMVPLSQGQMLTIIPLVLSVMLLLRFVKGYGWISRIATAVPIGVGAGVALRAIPAAQILKQVLPTITNLNTIDGWIILVGSICTVIFFLFTVKQTPVVRTMSQVGLAFMCITFGVTFAGAILTYVSIFYGPAGQVFKDWLGIVK